MTHRLVLFAMALAASLILTQCATVSAPTGGPKDEKAPVLLETIPESGTTNYKGKTIILRFDEWIKVDNPAQKVFTSPPLGNSVKYVARKNTLMVIFDEDELEDNTTYHINFGNNIKDVNENNPLNNYYFVFSTGDAIDSLKYQGQLLSINDAEINQNTLIGLYPIDSLDSFDDDSIFTKQRPFYFTFADNNGNFTLDYIKAGTYKVYALTDRNTNYFYDLPNEAIGFVDTLVVLEESQLSVQIPLFLPEPTEARVTSYTNNISNYKIKYELAKSVPDADSLDIVAISDTAELDVYYTISDDRKVIDAWLGKGLKGVKALKTVFFWNGAVVDTFEHTVSALKFPPLEVKVKPLEFTKNDSLIISLSSPMGAPCENIALIDTSNGDTVPISAVNYSDFQIVAYPELKNATDIVYTLLRADSCIFDIYGRTAEFPLQKLRYVSTEDRGSIILTFEGAVPSSQYIITLIDEKKSKIRRFKVDANTGPIMIGNLKPGKYKIDIIEDENRNGVWNSGSMFPRKLPERLYTHDKEFTLRPNWELEEMINLSAP